MTELIQWKPTPVDIRDALQALLEDRAYLAEKLAQIDRSLASFQPLLREIESLNGFLAPEQTAAPAKELIYEIQAGTERVRVDADVYEWASQSPWHWSQQDERARRVVRDAEMGKRQEQLHILVAKPEPGQYVWFKNRDGHDCRRQNLELVSRVELLRRQRAEKP